MPLVRSGEVSSYTCFHWKVYQFTDKSFKYDTESTEKAVLCAVPLTLPPKDQSAYTLKNCTLKYFKNFKNIFKFLINAFLNYFFKLIACSLLCFEGSTLETHGCFPKGKLHKGLSSCKMASTSHSYQCDCDFLHCKMLEYLLAFIPQGE